MAMLDPTWTPERGYSHATGLMEILARKDTAMHADREMILHPGRWPLNVLPLKRTDPFKFKPGNIAVFAPPMHVLRIEADEEIEIRLGTMYEQIDTLPIQRYVNVDALLADGWRVD